MIALSRRHSTPLAVLLILTLLPVLVHSYFGFRSDDCAHPDLLLGGCYAAAPDDGRREAWMTETLAATAWCEGTIPTDVPGLNLDVRIVRSYDPKKLYHNPELAFMRGYSVRSKGLELIDAGIEKIPIHRLHFSSDRGSVFGAYLMVYNSKPVSNPYTAQLYSFLPQLLTGSRPMTLYFVSGAAAPGLLEPMVKAGSNWLIQSRQRYAETCGEVRP